MQTYQKSRFEVHESMFQCLARNAQSISEKETQHSQQTFENFIFYWSMLKGVLLHM